MPGDENDLPLCYQVYGLQLCSNRPIPGLLRAERSERSSRDLKVWLNPGWQNSCANAKHSSPNQFSNAEEDTISSKPASPPRDIFRFEYSDGVAFLIDRNGGHIGVSWTNEATLEDAAIYLLGPILGFVLCLRNVTSLHASAVRIGNQAIALLGPSGAGKSTTAAAFCRLGYSVLSDDLVSLCDQDDHFLAQPGYPRLRLWPESVRALFGSSEALPCLTPTWEKRYLDLTSTADQFQTEALPLAGIYILGERRSESGAHMIEAVPLRDGLLTLLTNIYTGEATDKQRRSREFERLCRVARHVPLRRVRPHADPALLPKLCETIIQDYHTNLRKQ